MKIKIYLARIASVPPSSTLGFQISYPTYKENVANTYAEFVGMDVTRTSSTATVEVFVGGQSVTLTGNGITGISATGDYIIVNGTLTLATGTTVEDLLRMGYITYDIDGKTALITYLQSSDDDHVTKSLTEVGTILGKFNKMIGLKRIDIDLTGFAHGFNYVWIPSLKRYYYVDSVEMPSADITRLHLREDVLMSWSDLIRSQTAFVERQENTYDDDLTDEMCNYTYEKAISISSITMTNNVFTNTGNTDNDFVIETMGG